MIYELSNPVTKTLVTHLRDQRRDAIRFRHTVAELTKQLVYEALKDFPLIEKNIAVWQGDGNFYTIDEENIMVVTVLRSTVFIKVVSLLKKKRFPAFSTTTMVPSESSPIPCTSLPLSSEENPTNSLR